jgi:hypothetical protein
MIDPILPQLDPIDHVISVYHWRAAVIPELEAGDLPITCDQILARPAPARQEPTHASRLHSLLAGDLMLMLFFSGHAKALRVIRSFVRLCARPHIADNARPVRIREMPPEPLNRRR